MPNVVRGSKQHRMKVVADRPIRQFFILGAVFLVIFSASATGFLVAYAYNLLSLNGSESAQLQFALNEKTAENVSLRLSLIHI